MPLFGAENNLLELAEKNMENLKEAGGSLFRICSG